jgi:hypothetical protein
MFSQELRGRGYTAYKGFFRKKLKKACLSNPEKV